MCMMYAYMYKTFLVKRHAQLNFEDLLRSISKVNVTMNREKAFSYPKISFDTGAVIPPVYYIIASRRVCEGFSKSGRLRFTIG